MTYPSQSCPLMSKIGGAAGNATNQPSTPRDVADNGRIRLGGTMRLPATRG